MGRNLVAWGGLVVCLALGCGGKPVATVSGLVTYQGKPLSKGRVVFINVTGESGTGEIGPDGRYTLQVGPGTCQVSIQSREADTEMGRGDRKGPGGTMLGKSLIAERYADHQHSGLKFEVKAGQNTADFSLK